MAAEAPNDRSRVRTEVRGTLGRLTLDRPEALNALDLGMIEALTQALLAWRDDPAVLAVLIDGAGERGLCAGGDVRSIYDQVVAGHPDDAGVFFRAEYALNALIAEYPKPLVAFADGITMGGGIGLASHAAVRVVTERSRLAMPETRIGFTPDVGGALLLGRAPGRVGEYLGVAGATMDAADAVYAGFADHVVPSERLGALRAELAQSADEAAVRAAVQRVAQAPGPSRLRAASGWIDDAFSAATLAGIVERLHAHDAADARAAADVMAHLSPTAMAVTLAAVRRARAASDLRAVLAQDYGLVMWFVGSQPDLVEGIRAQLVDKDRAPRWQPATIGQVRADIADEALAFRPAVPLWS